jgi:5-(carboxyamino)imidazole ribonucleotide mutase
VPENLVPIILGSKGDMDHARAIVKTLDELGLKSEIRIASAHKATRFLLGILEDYEGRGMSLVYITVAGRSNALSGVVDANVPSPIIACPPPSDRFGGMDILSSLRMPSGLGAMVVLEPEAAGVAAAKILAVADPALRERVAEYQRRNSLKIEEDDRGLER